MFNLNAYRSLSRVYFLLYPFVRPYFGKYRRRSKVRFKVVGRMLYLAEDSDYTRGIWFYALTRARLYFQPGGIRCRLAMIKDKYQDNEVHVEANDIVIDVGANIGEFAIIACENGADVISFEPDPIAIRCLKRNSKGLNIQIIECALSSGDGIGTLYLASNTADSSLVVPNRYSKPIEVKTMSLDSAIDRHNISRIDFLKVEAEGAEPEVLAGAVNVLPKVRKVAVDVSPERCGQSTWPEVSAQLRSAGFKVWRKGPVAFGSR